MNGTRTIDNFPSNALCVLKPTSRCAEGFRPPPSLLVEDCLERFTAVVRGHEPASRSRDLPDHLPHHDLTLEPSGLEFGIGVRPCCGGALHDAGETVARMIDCLRDVRERMVNGYPASRLADPLPWNWKPAVNAWYGAVKPRLRINDFAATIMKGIAPRGGR